MEIEEPLQSLHTKQRTKQEDDAPEPTITSRRQAELEAANERLQRVAQNFSLEWKSFLGYAMKIKQQRTPESPLTGEKDLEDVLLKTQGGLVLLQDLHNRRDQQWKKVAERYGYHRQSIPAGYNSDKPPQQSPKQPQWLQTLASKLLWLNQELAVTAHCAVKKSQLIHQPGKSTTRSLNLLTLRAHAVQTHHRLEHGVASGSKKPDFVHVQDVDFLLQFDYMERQQAVVLERLYVRLKWLPVSHHFHLRQRMLALEHQQKVKNTPSTASRDGNEHVHCPLFVLSTSHFVGQLKALAQTYALPFPDGIDVRDKSHSEKFHVFKQNADEILASVVTNFPPDKTINMDGSLEIGLETLVHAYTRNSRWDLLQRGYLGNCEPGPGRLEDTLIALRNDRKIDSLLANEWELLSLDDTEYLRVRLETLSRAHMSRAQVDVAKSEISTVGHTSFSLENQRQSAQHADDNEHDNDLPSPKQTSGLTNPWNPDALYSLYVLHVSSCRAKRLSLLRLLNYLHFIQFCQISSFLSTENSRQKVSNSVRIPWNVTKCSNTGDFIVSRVNDEQTDDDVNGNNTRDHEFIFAAARRDLEVLELQLLRIASIFIFNQEYDSLPSYRSDSAVNIIDRLQVLRDIYDCEVAFQQAKVQLVDKLLQFGLHVAAKSQDFHELGFATIESMSEPFTDILLPLLHRRPYLDFTHVYFFESYTAETLLLKLQTSLIQQMEQSFQRFEWCPLQEFAMDQSDTNEQERRWVCQQILGSRALIRLYSQQNELVREADEKWFPATCVGQFHALQHALWEQMLVIWSFLIKFELSERSVRCLERSAGDLLVGNGWQLVFPPQLLSDVCQTLHEQTNQSITLQECFAQAIELQNWRQTLAKTVYEAHLLEKIHQFQVDFVKQVAAFDSGAEHARHRIFFFDFSECDRGMKALEPLAIELKTNSTPKSTVRCSNDNKSASEWLHDQLSALRHLSDDCEQANGSEQWRCSLLWLQHEYVAHLQVSVKYQDAVGADVFEFAASYPYVCLASSFVNDERATVAMDLSMIRVKYAKEIADKMTEEMRTSCFPYWKRLETLKQQLQERFATGPKQDTDSLPLDFHFEVDILACGHFLDETNVHSHLLTTLNAHLQRLRNEKKLMQQLGPITRTKCAFVSPSASETQNDEASGLTAWLMVKLHQLKVDLQLHNSYSSPSARATRSLATNYSSLETSSSNFLQTIPSFRSLLDTFAIYERNDATSAAATAHAIRLQESREQTLRTLTVLFHQFSDSLDLLTIRCGSRFASTRENSISTGQYTVVSDGAYSGLARLERWQTLYHDEIRQLLDHITSRLSQEAAVATGELFDTHPENLHRQHQVSLLRQEICTALEEENKHFIRMIRCTLNFAVLQTYQMNAGVRIRKRRLDFMNFRSLLSKIITGISISNGQSEEPTASQQDEALMKQLVRVGEQVRFDDTRPYEQEHEWQAFRDAVDKYEARDSAYIDTITRLLELHQVYIEENCRVVLRLTHENALPSLSLQCTAENQALAALNELWERFHLPAWDSFVGDEASKQSGRYPAPVVSGENLEMKKRLLGTVDLDMKTPSAPGTSVLSSLKDLSCALRSLQMGTANQFNTGMLVLPSPDSIKEQLEYLELSVELTWVDADMKKLENYYKKFLYHRKTHREKQDNCTSRNLPRSSSTAANPSFTTTSSVLLSLSQYFHGQGVPDKVEASLPVEVRTSKTQARVPVFIVPAIDMSLLLDDVLNQCITHNQQQFDIHRTSLQQLSDHCRAVELDRQKIEKQWAKARVQERIRREAFAVDHAYHLYFEVEALRKQLEVLLARRELDQQVLRCQLNAEYNDRLHLMHAELQDKQHKFAEYRTTMQRELQAVTQGAHAQFIDQLLDYSGTLPLTTTTSVSHLLRGQQDIVRIKSENAAMKQALVKVQALGDMQQQTQTAARDREFVLTQRFAMAEALQRNEVDQLQTYVKQLEGNLSKLSQEKTFFQVKWTTAQKQMEMIAQRRREAKVRALAATYDQSGANNDGLPTLSSCTRADSETVSYTESVMNVSTIRPPSIVDKQRLETQYLNSTRHYQNEIRRLKQQLTREIREKAAIVEQLTQLRQYESPASVQPCDALSFTESPEIPLRLPSAVRRTQSASSRVTLRPKNSTATPPDRLTTLRRPSSSFSPRASLLRTRVTGRPGTQPLALDSGSNTQVVSPSSRHAHKFQVVKRETSSVGGVAGVLNALAVREPLPYR